MSKRVKIYVTDYCPYCRRAEGLLTQKKIPFDAVDVTRDEKTRAWLVQTTGFKTVPQIFIDGKPVGGFDALSELDRAGKLDFLAVQQVSGSS